MTDQQLQPQNFDDLTYLVMQLSCTSIVKKQISCFLSQLQQCKRPFVNGNHQHQDKRMVESRNSQYITSVKLRLP